MNQLLLIDNFNARSIQDMLLNLIANLMVYYNNLREKCEKLFFDQHKSAYFSVAKMIKKIKSEIISDNLEKNIEYDYKKFSICSLYLDAFSKIHPSKNTNRFKEQLVDMLMNSIKWEGLLVNDFEITWLRRSFISLFGERTKIQFNDFIDYEILRELYYFDDVEMIISFDKNIRSIMLDVPGFKKFSDSIDLINTFKL